MDPWTRASLGRDQRVLRPFFQGGFSADLKIRLKRFKGRGLVRVSFRNAGHSFLSSFLQFYSSSFLLGGDGCFESFFPQPVAALEKANFTHLHLKI